MKGARGAIIGGRDGDDPFLRESWRFVTDVPSGIVT
jgi:hypothetical protein